MMMRMMVVINKTIINHHPHYRHHHHGLATDAIKIYTLAQMVIMWMMVTSIYTIIITMVL